MHSQKTARRLRTAFRALTAVCAAAACAVLSLTAYIFFAAPDSYYNFEEKEFSLSSFFGAGLGGICRKTAAVQSGNAPLSEEVELRLFGLFPVKTVTVETVPEVTLDACGAPFGVKILTDGVIVVGLNEIATESGNRNPAEEAGVHAGDIIVRIDGAPVSSNDDVAAAVSKSGGSPVALTCLRGGDETTLTLTPALSVIDRHYKAGLWVRDSSAGIGTVSFYDPFSGAFGGLGHAVSDVDTGEVLPVLQGDVVDVSIHDVVKGASGAPGELRGSFSSDVSRGTIYLNNDAGVFGRMFTPPAARYPAALGLKQEIRTGHAVMLTTVDGSTPEEFEIEIERISLNENSPAKNMIIRVTDPELLERCGGIVQGMSGSPILQDGRLVGAVTHVFVNDPTRGYAIFAEKMYQNVVLMRKESQAASTGPSS